jgi:hypothetical protein
LKRSWRTDPEATSALTINETTMTRDQTGRPAPESSVLGLSCLPGHILYLNIAIPGMILDSTAERDLRTYAQP